MDLLHKVYYSLMILINKENKEHRKLNIKERPKSVASLLVLKKNVQKFKLQIWLSPQP